MAAEPYSDEEREEIIAYGIERGKIILISMSVSLIIGILFGVLPQSIIFMLTFCSLRRYAGGYHADSQKRCYVISFAVIIITFWMIKILPYYIIADVFINMSCLVLILFLAPVENQNRQLETNERKKYGTKTKTIATFISLLTVFFRYKGLHNIIIPILMAFIIVSISLILGYIKNVKQKNIYTAKCK
ncbi:MAG: accessory gene regulator B family protein [Lachnospiraceae bacterium]|nr:accessory gene regulator B family protein [Lachnospiraceae bacterium]